MNAHRTIMHNGRETTLNDFMGFDCVIRVHADLTVTTAPDVWEPEVISTEGDLSQHPKSGGWYPLHGFSAQCGYSGPVMHPSEFVGGRMADHILTTPGDYVSLIVPGGEVLARDVTIGMVDQYGREVIDCVDDEDDDEMIIIEFYDPNLETTERLAFEHGDVTGITDDEPSGWMVAFRDPISELIDPV